MGNEVYALFSQMLKHSRLNIMHNTVQHGNTSCLEHTLSVVLCALAIADRLHIKVNRRSLIRGGILHDYFLYDWHDDKKERRIHGFTHPGCALKNAEEDFRLNRRERDIIKKHMFPLTIVPPRCREAWLICIADKICALKETMGVTVSPEIAVMMKKQENFLGKGR